MLSSMLQRFIPIHVHCFHYYICQEFMGGNFDDSVYCFHYYMLGVYGGYTLAIVCIVSIIICQGFMEGILWRQFVLFPLLYARALWRVYFGDSLYCFHYYMLGLYGGYTLAIVCIVSIIICQGFMEGILWRQCVLFPLLYARALWRVYFGDSVYCFHYYMLGVYGGYTLAIVCIVSIIICQGFMEGILWRQCVLFPLLYARGLWRVYFGDSVY